jgi:hypothetical protein
MTPSSSVRWKIGSEIRCKLVRLSVVTMTLRLFSPSDESAIQFVRPILILQHLRLITVTKPP